MNSATYALFLDHVGRGLLNVVAVENHHFTQASNLIGMLPQCALRTLDALHLAVVTDAGLGAVATADQGFSEAAAALGLAVTGF